MNTTMKFPFAEHIPKNGSLLNKCSNTEQTSHLNGDLCI